MGHIAGKDRIQTFSFTLEEHPFESNNEEAGTHSLGVYLYIYSKTLKVDGEMGLLFTVYNLRKAVSILSVPDLVKQLKSWGKTIWQVLPLK